MWEALVYRYATILLMIELVDLEKVIDQTTVIDISSLKVHGGEIAVVVGSVGSGSDILFQLLTGRTHPTRGSIRIEGFDPFHDRNDCSLQVGVLFSDNNLYKRLSVIENLRFYSRLYRLSKMRVLEVLEQIGLADQANVIADKLSTGLARRLALGRAILNHPKVLLLADIFTGCEQVSITLMSQVIRKLADEGATVLIFSEVITHLEVMCDTFYRLNQGRIDTSFDPREEQHRQRPFMVPARAEEKIILVDPAEILFVFAQGDHAYLQTLEGRLSTQFTLTELEKRLSRSGFFRTHRAYLVNLQQVKEVIPFTRDSFSLRLKDSTGTIIPLSKSAERELRVLLQY